MQPFAAPPVLGSGLNIMYFGDFFFLPAPPHPFLSFYCQFIRCHLLDLVEQWRLGTVEWKRNKQDREEQTLTVFRNTKGTNHWMQSWCPWIQPVGPLRLGPFIPPFPVKSTDELASAIHIQNQKLNPGCIPFWRLLTRPTGYFVIGNTGKQAQT